MEADAAVRTEGADIRREIDDNDGSTEVVRWEKFLPRMVLRVLLVEADDSTRQIIAALLRKCSYKVAAVPDGLMAWETLKGRPHNIDLILTEVELPSISGYALLTLVMEHDICKNIPVIMMSSHDSISMVLKCMLKGAADFLIKPVRRNELRNLWKHVWTRQNLAAGLIPQESPYTQHKTEAGSEKNSASDHSSDCAISSLKRKHLSDEGSDVQVLPRMECRNAANTDDTEKKKYRDYAALDEKTIISDRKTLDGSTRLESECASLSEDHHSTDPELGDEYTCSKISNHDEDVKAENVRENDNSSDGRKVELIEPSNGIIDLIGTFDGQKRIPGHLKRHDGTDKYEFTPELELSLTRCFPNDPKHQGVEGRDALNHSSASAFSRYNSKTLQPLFPTSTGKCTEFKENVTEPSGPSSNAAGQNVEGNSQTNGANLYGSQETETNLVIGQSAEAELAYQNTQKRVPSSGVRLDNACNGHIHSAPPNAAEQERWSPKLASQQEHYPYPTTTSTHENKGQLEGNAVNSPGQSMRHPDNVEDVGQARQASSASGYSRSSSMSNSAADHNSSSAYRSFTSGSDGNASFAVTSDKAGLNDGGHLFVRDGFRGVDGHCPSHREAALTKFRLKRKERCFEKKVRYQSRKRLAEQRPRVKGQFVRQGQNDASIGGAN